jgi:hypothetical protein
MALMLFWIKIGTRKIINSVKSSPFIIIWTIIIIGSFVYAYVNKYIVIMLDTRIIMIIPFLVLISLFKSLKNYHIIPVLLKYSKSKLQNNYIIKIFFIKQAIKNNIQLLFFNIIMFNNNLVNKKHIVITLIVTALSSVLSFILIWLKYSIFENRVNNKNKYKIKINPLIKSTIYDYLTPDFFAIAVVCIAFFLYILIEYIKNGNYEAGNYYMLFTILTIILSVGFMAIIDSIKNINWKFQAIISSNNFTYHVKRTMYFLIGFFGLLILLFIITGAVINLLLMLKYLYCIIVLFWVSIFIAFTNNYILIKAILLSLIIAFTIWINTLPAVFLPISIIPFLITLVKAKNEYKEWYCYDNM